MGNTYHREGGKTYYSEALMVSHQSAQYLFEKGIIDADEMREFDEDCLVQESEAAAAAPTHAAPQPLEMEHATA